MHSVAFEEIPKILVPPTSNGKIFFTYAAITIKVSELEYVEETLLHDTDIERPELLPCDVTVAILIHVLKYILQKVPRTVLLPGVLR